MDSPLGAQTRSDSGEEGGIRPQGPVKRRRFSSLIIRMPVVRARIQTQSFQASSMHRWNCIHRGVGPRSNLNCNLPLPESPIACVSRMGTAGPRQHSRSISMAAQTQSSSGPGFGHPAFAPTGQVTGAPTAVPCQSPSLRCWVWLPVSCHSQLGVAFGGAANEPGNG